MKEIRQLPPMYTGGSFQVLRDEKLALSMNDNKVSLLDIQDFKLLASLVQENEDISTFALSPNQEYLATANKQSLIRVFNFSMEPQEFSKMECQKVFRTPNQVCLQVKFDPSSRFLAAGTTDSHIKIFDVIHGF